MNHCITCRWYKDGHYHKVYVSPRCTVNGDDDCAYMRNWVCGLDGARLYQRKIDEISTVTTDQPNGVRQHDNEFNREAK